MKKVLLLACASWAVGNLSAAVVACPTVATMTTLMNFNSLANACFSQDKLFWNFNYTPTGNAGNSDTVTGVLIFQAGTGVDIHGWNFNDSVWSSGASFTLGYSIQVCNTAACLGSVVPGTQIVGADADYSPSAFGPAAGNEVVTWSGGCNATATLTPANSGPVPPGANANCSGTGPDTVSATYTGTTGTITQTTLRFYESIPTGTPEPLSMLLLGSGLVAVALIGRRKLVRK